MANDTLTLPVSLETVQAVLGQPNAAVLITGLGTPELAGIYLLQYLKDDKGQRPAHLLGKLLRELTREAEDMQEGVFASEVLNRLDRERLREGLALLEASPGINLMASAGWNEAGYLERLRQAEVEREAERLAHFDIKGVQGRLPAQHFYAAQVLRSETDENIRIQGYAGCGKTSLIPAVIDLLNYRGVPTSRILIVAQTYAQVQALREKLPPDVNTRTLNDLASDILPRDLTVLANRRMGQRAGRKNQGVTDAQIAAHFGLHEIGELSGLRLASAVRGTLSRFCLSADIHVSERHVPRWFVSECSRQKTTAALQAKVVVGTADALWDAMVGPPVPDFVPAVHGVHQIKYCALTGSMIPGDLYTHIIVDEVHDLSDAALQILNNGTQAVITLGDDYQNIGGIPPHHPTGLRGRELNVSFRAGKPIEQLVNPILQTHPVEPRSLYVGSEAIPTEIDYYTTLTLPREPATILTDDLWSVWAWAQRVAQSPGMAFALLDNPSEVNHFVSDAIDLFHHQTRPSRFELRGYSGWAGLAGKFGGHHAFASITTMLDKGYSHEDWQSTFSVNLPTSAVEDHHKIGTVRSAKNSDFDAVVLAPDLAARLWKAVDRAQLAQAESTVYTAITRCKRKLLAPVSLRNWIEEVAATPPGALLRRQSSEGLR